MTGFGRGQIKSKIGTFTAEIKTVNHRYLDLLVKLPKELQGLDPKIKDFIKKSIHRGRIEVFIERRGDENSLPAEINHTAAKSYFKHLERLGKETKLRDTPSLSLLCQMPGVIELRASRISQEKAWREIKKSVARALNNLSIMRNREGKCIEKEIKNRLKTARKKQKEIEKRLPVLIKEYRKKLEARLTEPGGKINNDIDISEELSRFSSHLSQISLFLNDRGEAGKKINFTIQEMMREVNTMAAKANDFVVSKAVILIKSELEKIKEQIQNIE